MYIAMSLAALWQLPLGIYPQASRLEESSAHQTHLLEFVEIESRVSPIEPQSADIKVVAPANPTCLRHKRGNRWWPSHV